MKTIHRNGLNNIYLVCNQIDTFAKGVEVDDDFKGYPEQRAFVLNASKTPYSQKNDKPSLIPLDE